MFCSKCGAANPEDAKVCSQCGAKVAGSAAPSEGEAKPEAETSVGLSANVAGLLCYVLGWITGIIFLVIEDKSKFVKFHAWQSIMTFGVLTVVQIIVSLIPLVNVILTPIVGIIGFVLWLILIIQAGSGKMWKLPGAGNWAERQASK